MKMHMTIETVAGVRSGQRPNMDTFIEQVQLAVSTALQINEKGTSIYPGLTIDWSIETEHELAYP